jgi:hypothetical protein
MSKKEYKYDYTGNWFTCEKCGRRAVSKDAAITNCKKCRGTSQKGKANCRTCGRIFHSTIGKDLCRFCYSIDGHLYSKSIRMRKHALVKKLEGPIDRWRDRIKILLVKMKWNLLSQIDIFLVAHIYMDITNNENKYSTLQIDHQIQYMLLELEKMMNNEFVPPPRLGRRVEQIDSKGKVVQEFFSMSAAAKHHDVHIAVVRKSCLNGGFLNKKKPLRFRWKD